jgi:hypothetical protein
MKLNKAGFWVWPASLCAGFSLAYSIACHWFGFLSASKINRLEMLLGFGVIFSNLSWKLIKRGSGPFFEKISRRRFYLYLGAAVVIGGAAALFVLPLSQNSLITQQAQQGGALTPTVRFLWIGLKLADFASLTGLLVVSAAIFTTVVNRWGAITRFLQKMVFVSPVLVIVLIACLATNLYISASDKEGTLHQLKPLPSNSLLSLVWTKAYMKKARGYTILFENYPGWTLVAPIDLLEKMGINKTDKLQRWGRLGSVVNADYPTDLSIRDVQGLLALKNVHVDNGAGLQYVAILEGDSNRNICLRTYKNNVFIVPVSLSPVCVSK